MIEMIEEDKREGHSNFAVLGREVSLRHSSIQNQVGTQFDPRYKHQSFIYKNKLYVHGGTTIPSSNFTDDPQDLFYYDFQKNTDHKWEKVKTKCLSKQFETLSGHAGVVNLNKFYMFGGSNSNSKQSNLLWRLNLDTYEWNKMQQKGEVPSARQCAFLMYLEKNWLVLYGGVSNHLVEIYNNFHFYNLDTRYWSKCEGSYAYQVYARLHSALCPLNDKLYLFGGTYHNRKNQQKFLNDFYQFSIVPPSKTFQGKIEIRRLISNVMPEARAGHNLIGLTHNYLAVYGGQNEEQLTQNIRKDDVSLVQDMWIYNIQLNTWYKIDFKTSKCMFRTMATCNIFQDKLYVLGGLVDYSSVLDDFSEITINIDELSQYGRRQAPCLKCYEKKQYEKTQTSYSLRFIEQISRNIEFPFAAFGLLVDNAMGCGASHINICFHESFGSQKVNTIRVEDDSKIKWTDDELLDSLINYESSGIILPNGVDKKIKAATLKQNHRRQYGLNLKNACLRLGQSFLFVNLSPTEFYFRIFLMQKTNIGTQDEKYVTYYYTYSLLDKNDLKPEMLQSKKYVQSKYYDYFKDTYSHRYAKNTVFIFNPRANVGKNVGEEEQQLKVYKEYNDILYGAHYKIEKLLQKSGYTIFECVDISLRAYLTCLYLKNQIVNISFGVRQFQLAQIHTQIFLEKVDKLCRSRNVLEISSVLQFDLKIIELYFLDDSKKKLSFFSNGLLIYHKNRLVMRYKYPLGQLISRKYYKLQGNHNFLRLFGFIQLPEHIPINIFRTACSYPIILEKLVTRIKFISKYFKKQSLKMLIEPDYKRAAPSRPNEQEILREIEQEQKKKKISKVREVAKYSQAIVSFRQSKRISQKMKVDSNNNISEERQQNFNENGTSNGLNKKHKDDLKQTYFKFNFNESKPEYSSLNDFKSNDLKHNKVSDLKQNKFNREQKQIVQIVLQKQIQSGQQKQFKKDEMFDELQVENNENNPIENAEPIIYRTYYQDEPSESSQSYYASQNQDEKDALQFNQQPQMNEQSIQNNDNDNDSNLMIEQAQVESDKLVLQNQDEAILDNKQQQIWEVVNQNGVISSQGNHKKQSSLNKNGVSALKQTNRVMNNNIDKPQKMVVQKQQDDS